ncbi:tigger transposable element-derived protein 6-like [Dermacentor andersoni]|uniref:tigger transposable element-derived protein 6-like n=1 Tax=Dermacentor andersoni TaxID=34620 RepID=UPI0021558919|nr:tigger transposable element-derived protein 6-like [Dermacentor andersoni]
MSRKWKALSFKEKIEILKKVDDNPKKKRVKLAKELGIARSTLCTTVGQRDVVMKNAQHFGMNVKQVKTATHVKLEEVLLTWFGEVTAAGVNVDGKVLCEKTDNIALSLGIENFQASGGWLHRFKERHGLPYRVVCGEGKKADQSAVSDCLNTLPALISDYALRDVVNADEAGLFFNFQPERSLCVKGQACQGGPKSKERITVLFCVNADGSEKMQLTVIGKSKQPRSWDNVTSDTIVNCFRKCIFKTGWDAAPTGENEEPDEDFGIEGWGSLQTEASAHDFVTADDNVATYGLRSIEELVDEVNEVETKSDGEDADVCDQLPATLESLNALNVICHTVSASNVSDKTTARFYDFQACLVNDLEGKEVQASITDFFGRK